MADFSALIDGLDEKIQDHLCDDAVFRVRGSTTDVAVRATLDRSSEASRMIDADLVRARPLVRFPVSAVAAPKQGDRIQFGAVPWDDDRETFELAEAPQKPDDGRWWVSEVTKAR